MIRIFQNHEALSRAAAEIFLQQAREALIKGGFSVALAGGHTPQRAYELLAQAPTMSEVPWQIVHFFWGDERWVPPSDPQSNERMARKALLDHIPVPEDQIYPVYQAGMTPQAAAQNYHDLLRHFFTGEKHLFDLTFLGLGENGHTASLFPGTPVLQTTNRLAEEVFIPDEAMFRITLTPDAINQSALVVFLVSGSDKADIVQQVLEGPRQPERWPAQLIRPAHGKLLWLLDEAAARKLENPAALQAKIAGR
jgi:6-phosphogluconolactonase